MVGQRFRTSINIYSVRQFIQNGEIDIRGFITYAAEQGFDGVDLGYFWKDKEAEISEVSRWLDENNIVISGYHVGNNFAKFVGTAELRDEIARVKTAIDDAHFLGANVLRVFAGKREGLTWEKGASLIADCFRECTDYAEKKNVILAIENHGGLGATSEHILFYIRTVDSPYLRATVDTGNFWACGEHPHLGVENTAPYAAMVHIKDIKKANGKFVQVPTGEGDIDFKICFEKLVQAGYSGYLCLEYEAAEDPSTGIRKSLAHIKQVLQEIGA